MSDPMPAAPRVEEEQGNPFAIVAALLRALADSLEANKLAGEAPRWVRIARIRAYRGKNNFISKAVIPAVDKGLAFTVLYLAHLTLQARDLLTEADAAKAFEESSVKTLQVVSSDAFADGLAGAIGQKAVVNPLREARNVADAVAAFSSRVPGPADLEVVSAQLYRLLCLEQLPLEEAGLGATTEMHLNLEATGKIRLLQMALGNPVRIRELGANKQGEQELSVLGARRLWPAAAAALPSKAVGRWGSASTGEIIYEFDFANPDLAGQDIAEVNGLLEKLGYVEPAVADVKVFGETLQRRLRRFQMVNGLKEINGQLDNPTLNGLQHLNYEKKSLQRAKPFDAAALKDFDDTKNVSR